MNKSYSVTDWALHDGNTEANAGADPAGMFYLQDEDNDSNIETEQKAAYENRSSAEDEEPKIKQGEESESRLFAKVDDQIEEDEEKKENIELPAVIHAKSPSPLPEDIGNPVECVKRTLKIIDSLS
ncbi:uncharacterized protein LOC133181911 [Saccostrea echinata]|uniref:uncharacterized protein LOC133181911 n=1 Tax=Saccostrea echinata TaxID=191078 RepID=UPI002A81D2E1|nr:uncharacterized protein LOC133181911 [Saccostrea echinata]